jgi:hypothetical protein
MFQVNGKFTYNINPVKNISSSVQENLYDTCKWQTFDYQLRIFSLNIKTNHIFYE